MPGIPRKSGRGGLSLHSRRQAWDATLLQGVPGAGLTLVSDNGSQPTVTGLLAAMRAVGSTQVPPSDDGSKGTAETKRLEGNEHRNTPLAAGVPDTWRGE